MAANFVLLIIGGYLLGSVPSAYLAARWSRGIDIRQYGSGNVGSTNLMKFTSKRVAIPAIVFDLGKGMLVVWVAQLMHLGIAQQVTVGLAVIVGHNWSVFLRFSGGRGVLATLGVALILPLINNLVPWGVVVGLTLVAIGLFVLHSLPLGVVVGVAAMPLVSWGFDEPLSITLGFLAMFLILVLKRLTAPRTSLTTSVSIGQLLVNRFLFDRDIRDREAWIHRVPYQASSAEPPEKQGKG